MKNVPTLKIAVAGALIAGLTGTTALTSSHREAPFITETPKVDGTDFYMFRSYEPGRSDYTTLIANYLPLQAPYGGPNYFQMDEDALYEIHVDNDGDAVADMSFRFDFENTRNNLAVPVGDKTIEVPLINIGPIGVGGDRNDTGNLNVEETYTVSLVDGDTGESSAITSNASGGISTFKKPVDYIGTRSVPDYIDYANSHIYTVQIPGCSRPGRLFVGQRDDPFVVNLGQAFDLVNTGTLDGDGNFTAFPPFSPNGNEENADAGQDAIADANVTSLALEVPTNCLTSDDEPVIGAWTTASLPRARLLNSTLGEGPRGNDPAREAGGFVQVSRLGNPLVNEVVIGLNDKDIFNGSTPSEDAQFLDYVTNPSFPELVEILFGPNGAYAQVDAAQAPDFFPREDLVAIYLTGVNLPGVLQNQPADATPGEMLRLNTSTSVTAPQGQSNLGVLGGDAAGFPNGRRPGDDVVDITLRAAMGAVLPALGVPEEQAPAAGVQFTDGATAVATDYQQSFPYINPPFAGDLTAPDEPDDDSQS